MTDIGELMSRRATRGEHRGADAVLDAARLDAANHDVQAIDDHPINGDMTRVGVGQRVGVVLAVAASAAIVVGFGVFAGGSDPADDGIRSADGSSERAIPTVSQNADSIETRTVGDWDILSFGVGDEGSAAVVHKGPLESSTALADQSLVVEAEAAPGVQSNGSLVWHELVVTTATEPSAGRAEWFMAADQFPGHDALGCRLQTEGNITCELRSPDGSTAWVSSFFQDAGTGVVGGTRSGPNGDAYPVCPTAPADPSDCGARFRLELTTTSLRVLIDNRLYFEQSGISFPSRFTEGPLTVWASSVVTSGSEGRPVFSWGQLSVNP